jgi:methionine synthase / methylenetetrahydrofolate reductase (NADH)
MLKPFLEALEERVLVCDGAMGTMLYAKGVFINKSFDALNLTQPDLVAEVHGEYVRAGADIIETNTFGANRIKLGSFGLADKLHAINVQGAKIARHAARESAYVAGAIGPLGIRIEPWGKTGLDEAREYFREQAAALTEGGVDLFVLETFRDLNEIGAAIDAVRSVSDLPIVAQMTTEEDGNTLDGTPPERFTPELERRGATVVGVNCAVGPAPMLDTIERMAAVTDRKLSAARRRGAQHLSLLARVHGVLRAALHPASRAHRRRLLRHDAGARAADQNRSPQRRSGGGQRSDAGVPRHELVAAARRAGRGNRYGRRA